MNWTHAEIVAYYSRLLEEYGGSSWVRYLLKDSLACTLMNKHRLRSRASVYKWLGTDLGGFPMPSRLRLARFRTDAPAPRATCEQPEGCPLGRHVRRVVHMRETLADVEREARAGGAQRRRGAWRRASAGPTPRTSQGGVTGRADREHHPPSPS